MAWDDRTPVEQAIIGYCVPRGIRFSEFRDLWSDEDQQAVYDWLESQARCDGCGQPLTESMRKENTFAYKATALDCHGCKAVAAEAARRQKGKPDPNAGTRFRVTRREVNDGRVNNSGAAVGEARAVS